jgi:hypothetical protein
MIGKLGYIFGIKEEIVYYSNRIAFTGEIFEIILGGKQKHQ